MTPVPTERCTPEPSRQVFTRMSDRPNHARKRIRGRLCLLPPLGVLMILGGILITQTPAEMRQGTAGSWLSGDNRCAVFYEEVSLVRPDRMEVDVKVVDLATGRCESMEIPPGHMIDAARDKEWNVYLLQHPLDESGAKLIWDAKRVIFLDFSSRTTKIGGAVEFPDATHSRLLGGRYWVALSEGEISVLDIQDDAGKVRSIDAKTGSRYIHEQGDSNRFFLIYGNVSKQAAPTSRPIEMYEIVDDGWPSLIASWPAGLVTGWAETDHSDEFVYSLSPDLKQIEVRSVEDGTIEKIFPVPGDSGFGAGDSIYSQILSIKKGTNHFELFDLETREWLPSAGRDYRLHGVSPDRRYVVLRQYGEGARCQILERESGEFLGAFLMPKNGTVFVVEDQVVITSERYRYSVQFRDLKTGRLLREIKPLAWLVYLLFALIILYAGWSVSWMVVSAREGGWAWFDAMLVIGLPALLMILRTALRGEPIDLARPPTRGALASVIAGEMLAMSWIVFGKSRFSIRILPMLILIASHMVWLTAVFQHTPWIVWHASKCAIVPAVCLTPFLLGLRWLGWRPRRDASATPKSDVGQSLGRSKYPLRDLILITVAAAFLFAAVRPVAEAAGEFVFVNTDLFLPLGVAVVCGLTAFMLSLHRRRGLFGFGVLLATAGVVYLVGTPVSLFASGDYTTRVLDPYLIETSIAAGIALFVALIPYRIRAWTFAR